MLNKTHRKRNHFHINKKKASKGEFLFFLSLVINDLIGNKTGINKN